MAITTYTEYQAASHALYLAQQAEDDAAEARRDDCHALAEQRFDAAIADDVPFDVAAAVLGQEIEQCDKTLQREYRTIREEFEPKWEQLEQEARENLARLPRLIIASDELHAAALLHQQSQDWSDAPILTVASFEDLRREFERDCFTNLMLLMINAENEQLIIGAERRTITDIVADFGPTVKLHVDDGVSLRGELVGSAPTDADVDSLGALLGAGIDASWTTDILRCRVERIEPDVATLFVGVNQEFKAWGDNTAEVAWTTRPRGSPRTGVGWDFITMWKSSGRKRVSAECGESRKTATVTVVEVKGIVTPVDDFAGRRRTRFGLAEEISLSFKSTPQRPAQQLGGLRWFADSVPIGGDAGTLTGTDGDDGRGEYTAPETSGAVVLALKVVSGRFAGMTVSSTVINIIEPSHARMVRKPGTPIFHNHGTWSVGFIGECFLRPKDVSFSGIEWGEGECLATAKGYLAHWDKHPHVKGPLVGVGPGNAETGCKVLTPDQVWGRLPPPPPAFDDGAFNWPIPWEFSTTGELGRVEFMTADQFMTADRKGTATIEKVGAGPFSRVPADETEPFPPDP